MGAVVQAARQDLVLTANSGGGNLEQNLDGLHLTPMFDGSSKLGSLS